MKFFSGNNQAAIIVVAYLVAVKQHSLRESLCLVKCRRPRVHLGVEYLWQLLHLESAVKLSSNGFLESEPSPSDLQNVLDLLYEDLTVQRLSRFRSAPKLPGAFDTAPVVYPLKRGAHAASAVVLPCLSYQTSIVSLGYTHEPNSV